MTDVRVNGSGLIVFSDFDGTIATRDVGNRLFHHFSDGRSDEPVVRWRAGEIDSRQCLLEESQLIRNLTDEELSAFIDTFDLDPEFAPFAEFCRASGTPLYILSDGLDIYINRLLARNGLTGLPVLANRAEIADGRLRISWPYFDHTCGSCGNCKGYHVRRLRPPGRKAVYIGDGKSDVCAVPEADMIFAKGYLADYCRKRQIEYLPFDDFSIIRQVLDKTINERPNHRL
jgi:2-hydroxy-3-keto-5-methylthiopentenyl-1-phosphate phosphatase